MANSVLLKRSSTENKRPVAANMLNGELDLNYSDISGGIFYKNASGSVVKVGPAQVGTTAPNSTPAGSAGNSVGEFWFDTSISSLKLWDGSAWQTCGALTYPGTTSYTPVSYVQWPTPANPTDRVAVEGDVTALFSAGQLIAFPDVSGATQYTLQSTQYLSGSDATAFTFAVNPAPATTYSGPLLITAATQYAVRGVNAGTGISLSFDTVSDSLTINNSVPPITFAGKAIIPPSVNTASAPNVFTCQGNEVPYFPVGAVLIFSGDANENEFTVLSSTFNVGSLLTTITVSPNWAASTGSFTPSSGATIYRYYYSAQTISSLSPGDNVTFSYIPSTTSLSINAATTAATTPGGPTGAIQFNNAGVFGGEAEFVWDSVNNWVRVPAIYGAVDSLTIGATTSGGGAGGLLSLAGGNATANAGQTGGGVSIFAGGGGAGGTGGSVTIRAASTGGTTGNGGDITITGGTGQGATFTSGNVVIAPGSVATGATSGTVQISGISAASATATYTPTAATDLATKAYVDAAADGGVAGANTQVQFNNNGAFGASSNLTFTAASGSNPSYLSLQKIQGFDAQNLTLLGGTSGQVNITGGDGLVGSTINGGNILLTPGTAAPGGIDGQTQIFSIGLATTIAGYTPLTANSLTDKAYVDGRTNPVAWIPNDTAPTTANNGDFWLNTNTGPFTLEQRIGGAWVTNDTTSAITNNIINTAAFDVPYPTLYDIIGVSAGRGGFISVAALNAYTDDSRYNVTSSFNKITGVLTFTYSVTSGTLDYAGLTTGWVVGGTYDFYYTLASGDDIISYILTGYEQNAAGSNTIQFTARVLDSDSLGYALVAYPQITGAVETDYEITGLGKNVFNGVSTINPAFRGVLTNNTPTTGSYLFWSAPSNDGGPYEPADWQSVRMADMIESGGTGIGITYNTLNGQFVISNTAPGPSYNVKTPLAPTVVETPGDGTFTNFGDSTSIYTLGLVIIFTGDPSYTRYTVTGASYDNGNLKTTVSVTPNWSTSGFTPAANATTSSTTVAPIAFLNPGNNITFDYYTLQDAITINATTQTTPAAGANTQIQFNDNGAFGASGSLSWDATNSALLTQNLYGNNTFFNLLGLEPTTSGTTGGSVTVAGGQDLLAPGTNGGLLVLHGGDPGSGGIGGDVVIYGGNPLGSGSGGDITITGGVASGAGNTGGNVVIGTGAASSSATRGSVQISNISVASATATYTPSAATDLATKAYVDGSSIPVAWIPNDTAPTTANNGDFWLTTGTAAFGLQQRINGAWVSNETSTAILNNIINTATTSTPLPNLSQILGIGGSSGYNANTVVNNLIFATNYTVTSSFNKVTNVLTFTFTNTTGDTNVATLLTNLSNGVRYFFQMAGDQSYRWLITNATIGNTAPFPVTFTAVIPVSQDRADTVAALAAVSGATVTDYEITGLGKNIFNGTSSVNPAVTGVLAPTGNTTGTFLYWSAPSQNGNFYSQAQWKLVPIADMITAGTGIGVTYDAQFGTYELTSTATATPAGANTQVQYNNNGVFGAEADFAYVAGTNTLTVGNISGNAANFSLVTPAQATAEANGYDITIAPGDGGTGQGVGGVLTLRGGGGTYGGDVNITGAVSSVAAGFSGSVYINGGAPGVATAEGGTVEIRGSATANLANAQGGNLTLAGGSVIGAGGEGGDAYVSGGNAANPGDLILFAGTTTANNGTGGDVAITGGLVAAGIGTSGTAGNISITGGTGAGSTNVTGGNVTIAGGAPLGTGTRGGVSISDITVASAKATYVPTANTDLATKSYVDGALVPGGSNGQVQFNNNGVFGGDADLTYNPATNILTIPNILSGNATLDLIAGPQTLSNNPGHDVSLSAGAGNGNGAGGAVIITGGGSSGLAVAGGAVNITGGNATGTNNTNGGNVVVSAGTGVGSGTAGNVIITDISQVTAKATYTPTNGVDLTTKSYVDQFSAGNNRFYGEFSSTISQANEGTAGGATPGQANLVTYNTTIHTNGVTVANGSRLTMANAGVYNIQFSVQWLKSDAGSDVVYLWFRKNGVDVANSNSSWTLTGAGGRLTASLNYVNTFNANDYIELAWWSADANLSLDADPAAAAVPGTSPAQPAIPSVIVTVVPV
jgi:hypothetical protein